MKLLLLRHAESQGNATGNYSTAVSDSLSEKGKKQAIELVDGLRQHPIDEIIVSPRTRTIQTITPYLQATGRRGEIWPEIAEACWHDEREPPTKTWRSQPATLPDSAPGHFCFRDDNAIIPEHPETFGESFLRVHEALAIINDMTAQSNEFVLMVAHGHFIRETLNIMLATDELREFHHDNCGRTLLSFNGEWGMEFFNRPLGK